MTMRSKVSIVQGVGINDATTSVYHKGFPNADYAAWSGMLMRCYCETYQKSYNLYLASCRSSTGKRLTQTFSTVDAAASWYKQTKKRVIKEQAIQAFLDNAIETDVYLALVRREF